MLGVTLRKTSFLWLVAVTSLITFVFLVQVQLTWKSNFLEQHKYWYYDLEKEEPLQPDQKCFLPRVHPFDTSILRYLSPPKSIKCKERQLSLTFIDDKGVLKFNETSLKHGKYNPSKLQCYFQELVRKNDFEVEYGAKIQIPLNGSQIQSDFVYVSCTDFSGIAFYTNIHCHIVPKNKFQMPNSNETTDNLPYNVLIIGIDSLSRLSFIRYLPETYEFLTKTLNAFVFRGMTKVGDNTFPNLVAILTGKSVFNDELPKIQDPKETYDKWPCLWKNFSNASYATLFAEDQPKIGLFNYLRGGLQDPPTDHYLRTFWLAVQTSKLHLLSSSLCFGNVPKHLMQMHYTQDFVRKYNKLKTPFFAFTFFVELSHDYVKVVSSADDDFKTWLSDLFKSGYLNNTFLLFLSDHGHRFDAMRATLIGRIEERMPFFSLVVPPSLFKTHPQVIENLKLNVKRLTTPYDIHFTVMDILGHFINRTQLGTAVSSRGTTMFAPISSERTCQTAGVPDHYCICETEESLDVSGKML